MTMNHIDTAILEDEQRLRELDAMIDAGWHSLTARRIWATKRIFAAPAHTLPGLAAQARAFMSERELDRRMRGAKYANVCVDDFREIGAVLAEGIARLVAR
jgi:hypothetical protein